MTGELPKQYNPSGVEERVYGMWMESGLFAPSDDPSKQPFTIVIPPPNVTGQLHLGHAFDDTLQDVLIRFKRMNGFAALWVPGTDHAGIATQIRVEQALREEGLSRHDLGREAFVRRTWEWKEHYGGRIVDQLKKLGCSCDWNRLRFTMDEGLTRAVREVFVNLYEQGLIYRGRRIINWCPSCRTALSDTEVEYEERDSHLWHIRYPLTDGSGFITIATTRPETMLGDTAVAIHPDDDRTRAFLGKKVLLPLMNREIPIVADDYVDKEFGTGCVKITPCHDPNDFELAGRHNLPEILIFDEDARVNENGGVYQNLTREEARKAVLRDLESGGFLVKTVDHVHNAGTCHRCHKLVEPLASEQWFVKMSDLAAPAADAAKNGDLRFVPERFSKTYLTWMDNVRDWCISRQLWWGHRIPVWYCGDCQKLTVSREDALCCQHCQSSNIRQDEDVLDTWFSSALWPFSTLGWPEKTADFERFYPTDVLVTGYDIIFFWVARMVFSGLKQTGQAPFHTVYMHGMIRDAEGRKMSKSLGNGIDPIDIINQYGADALRIYIITCGGPGNDARFSPDRCEAMRNFCNKLWNASRFVLMNLEGQSEWGLPEALDPADMWILTGLQKLIGELTANLEQFELGMAMQKIHDFIWDDFCDWYIELSKARLSSDVKEERHTTEQVLCMVLETSLRLLHPFAPFITEEIWQSLPHSGDFLMGADWPEVEERLIFEEETAQMNTLMDAIRAVRSRRAEMKIQPSRRAAWTVVTDQEKTYKLGIPYFQRLAMAGEVTVTALPPEKDEGFVRVVLPTASIFMPLADLVDLEAEKARLTKELASAKKEETVLSAKLNNPGFVSKAPPEVVKTERERLAALQGKIQRLEGSLGSL